MAALGTYGLRALCSFLAVAAAVCSLHEEGLEQVMSIALLQTGAVHHDAAVHFKEKGHEAVAMDANEAVLAHQKLSFLDGASCPTTYIYNIPELWDLQDTFAEVTEHSDDLLDRVWGGSCENGAYCINQYSMQQIVIYRLMNSKRCRVTTNPEEADLFLVPYRPRPKLGNLYCSDGGINPEPFLTHLSPKTAHKHMFLLGKGHILLSRCGDWWRYPTGLLSHAIRVTYSLPVRPAKGELFPNPGPYGPLDSRELTYEKLASMTGDFWNEGIKFPHAFSVPYPSTGLLGLQPPNEVWKDLQSERPVLAYFFGGMHGFYGLEIRLKIREVCEKVGAPTCLYINPGHNMECQALAQKQKALFCLEPGGDSPYRKSLFDDLSLGCVPVLFSPYMQLVAPWHWGHWRNESHVYINRADFLEGKLDLFQVLQDIANSPRLEQMRTAIAANAHSVQYSRHDYPGDGVERLLIGAHNAAKQIAKSRGL